MVIVCLPLTRNGSGELELIPWFSFCGVVIKRGTGNEEMGNGEMRK